MCQPLSAGAILVGNRGVLHQNRFSPFWHVLRCHPTARNSNLTFLLTLSVRQFFVYSWYIREWQLLRRRLLSTRSSSPIRHSWKQLSSICSRTAMFTKKISVHYVLTLLPIVAIKPRIRLNSGWFPAQAGICSGCHKWKTARVMPERKLQTDAVAKVHDLSVTLLPCGWTSILTEFKKSTEHKFLMTGYQRSPCLSIFRRSSRTALSKLNLYRMS